MPSFRENPRATNLALYPTMFPSIAWWNYELLFRSQYYALTSFFLNWSSLSSWWLEGSTSMMSLHSSYYSLSLNCRHLFFGTSLHSSLLVGDYVCNLSYKSNAFVWLETFHKEYSYWKILCINIWSCNYFSQYNIHPYLTKTFLDAFHLYQDNIEIEH